MDIGEIAQALENLQGNKLGDAYFVFSAHIILFPGPSGEVIVELHRTDGQNQMEKLIHKLGVTRVEKKFPFNNAQQLSNVLEDLSHGDMPMQQEW